MQDDAGNSVGFPFLRMTTVGGEDVLHVAALGDQADIFGNRGVRGTGPLAIDYFVKVVGGRDIGRFHSYPVRTGPRTPGGLFELRERLRRVQMVFELDHRVILLEPFRTVHKGKFVRS